MPVIQVFAEPRDDAADKLRAMCRAVSNALSLQPDDVVATHICVAQTVVPGRPATGWPVIVVHGSRRPQDQMADACDRLRAIAATWNDRAPVDGVWVTWQLSQ